nr:hypothetical protein [Tanacetum cinerariifolium]
HGLDPVADNSGVVGLELVALAQTGAISQPSLGDEDRWRWGSLGPGPAQNFGRAQAHVQIFYLSPRPRRAAQKGKAGLHARRVDKEQNNNLGALLSIAGAYATALPCVIFGRLPAYVAYCRACPFVCQAPAPAAAVAALGAGWAAAGAARSGHHVLSPSAPVQSLRAPYLGHPHQPLPHGPRKNATASGLLGARHRRIGLPRPYRLARSSAPPGTLCIHQG